MLSRAGHLIASRVLAILAATVFLSASAASQAMASPPVTCPPGAMECYVVVTDPGVPPRPGDDAQPVGGPPTRRCVVPGTGLEVSCFNPLFGTFSDEDGCYYRLASPQPPAGDPLWEGHIDGAIWDATCPGSGGTGGGLVWRANPPAGVTPTGPTPAQLAEQAIADLVLKGPAISTAPAVGTTGLVGLPVWLWTAVTPQTWGPQSATAAVPGLSVTATARAVRVVWSMGDGASVVCTTPGTPYTAAQGNVMSPDCGYRYARSSAGRPGEVFAVTATTTWRIEWAGGGQSGQLTQTRVSSTALRIGELQVLIR